MTSNVHRRRSNDSEKEDEDVFEDDSEESQLEKSIKIQRSYKDLIRKLENDALGLTQSSTFSSGGPSGIDSQFGVNENLIMKRLMDEAHDLYKNVEGPHEARLDARLLKQMSRICRLRSQELSVNQQKFQVSEFADKLIQEMGCSIKDEDETINSSMRGKGWTKLGKSVQSIFNRTPYFSYLLGCIITDDTSTNLKPKRNVRVRNESNRPATEANVVDFNDRNSAGNTGENMTDVFVEATFKQLGVAYKNADKEPICYFSFVMDPTSFGRTIENMFYTSFLIKEGNARIFFEDSEEDGNRMPYIVPIRKKKHEDNGSNMDKKKQVLMTISIEEWIRLRTVLKRTAPMINHNLGAEDMGMKPAETQSLIGTKKQRQ